MNPIRKTPIRTFGGKILGFVEEDKFGNQQVKDFYGKIISRYDKRFDVTRDFYGRILSQGNTAVGLLYK